MEKHPWSRAMGTGRAHFPALPPAPLQRLAPGWRGQPRPPPPLRSHNPALRGTSLSSLARSVKLRLFHRALKGLQAPGATQALQTAGTGLQNRLLPHPVDLNPGHACPCDSNSAQAKAPLPALPRRSFPFVCKGTPLNERGCRAGMTHSQIVGEALRADGAHRGLTLRQRRLSEAWDKLMSIVLLFLSESKSKSNYKIQR